MIEDFDDAKLVSEWAMSAYRTFIGGGIAPATEDQLMPGAEATRKELAQLLYEFLK